MKDQDNIVDKGWNDIYYTISVNFAFNPWYNLIDEREKKVSDWCALMSLENLEAFKRKAEEIMSKEEADKLACRVEELSCDRENIALYTKLTNEEMVFNTRLANATETAKEQGSKETSIENAKNAIALGLDDETISKITGLSLEDIAKLRTNN